MSKTISRRSLLKGMVAGAAGVASLGVISASAEAAPVALYKAGTYTSIQSSGFASVEVTCTFSETALTDVTYKVLRTSSADYFTPFAALAEDYCKRIVANGKAEGVDGITGATLCAEAIRGGVNDCTAQALGIPAAQDPAKALNPQVEDFDTFNGDCAQVFSPVKLGSMEIPNRVIKAAGSSPWKDVNGKTEPISIALYTTMAKNNVPLNIVAGGVIRNAAILPDSLSPSDDIEAAMNSVVPLIESIHQNGGKIGYQMCFGGLAPTVPDAKINESPIEELDAFIDRVGISAERGKKVGFDCIEIKGASADGLNGFLTRRINKREDEYGPQSIENRTRLFRRMIQKIKEVNGADFPVGALINGVEENDVLLGNNEGFTTIDEGKAIAKALVEAGADWIQVRVGVNGQEMNIWAPDVQHTAGDVHGITGYGTQFDFSSHFDGLVDGSRSGYFAFMPIVKAIKEAVDVPVGCAAGMDLRLGPDYLNDAIARGELDLIFMNRPLNCDPELVTKIKEHRREDVRPCMHCMQCHDNKGSTHKKGVPDACRMNAASYHAFTDVMPEGFDTIPAETKKNIMVIGAGPAVMEAARVAAERGHTVTLYEASDKLGGLIPFVRGVKGDHERFDDYLVYIAQQLNKLGVTVNLRTKVDAAMVKELKPDAVVVAVGGVRESKFAGENVFLPEAAFGSKKLGENIVILGANVQAIDFATHLVNERKKVTIVHGEPVAEVDKGQGGWFRTYILPYLNSNGVKIWNEASVNAVGEAGVTITTSAGFERTIPCDSVIECYDMVPNTALAAEIEAAGIPVFTAGDCAEPYNIQKAVLAGNLAARKL